jgi:hypothetical protein
MEISRGAACQLSPVTQRGRRIRNPVIASVNDRSGWEGVSLSVPGGLFLLWWSGRILRAPQAPMHRPDAGRPVFIFSRDVKLEAHDKRGTG